MLDHTRHCRKPVSRRHHAVATLLSCTLLSLTVTGCSWFSPKIDEGLVLTPVEYSDLPGWQLDDLDSVMDAFQKSCTPIQRRNPEASFGLMPEAGHNTSWQQACGALAAVDPNDTGSVRALFENHFQPFAVRAGNSTTGLFTGYYEASLKGSRIQTEHYRYPLHERPEDLVMVDLGEFREDLRGQRIAGRVSSGRLKPYEERAEIDSLLRVFEKRFRLRSVGEEVQGLVDFVRLHTP